MPAQAQNPSDHHPGYLRPFKQMLCPSSTSKNLNDQPNKSRPKQHQITTDKKVQLPTLTTPAMPSTPRATSHTGHQPGLSLTPTSSEKIRVFYMKNGGREGEEKKGEDVRRKEGVAVVGAAPAVAGEEKRRKEAAAAESNGPLFKAMMGSSCTWRGPWTMV